MFAEFERANTTIDALSKKVNKKVMQMFEKAEQEYNELKRKKDVVENDKGRIEQARCRAVRVAMMCKSAMRSALLSSAAQMRGADDWRAGREEAGGAGEDVAQGDRRLWLHLLHVASRHCCQA